MLMLAVLATAAQAATFEPPRLVVGSAPAVPEQTTGWGQVLLDVLVEQDGSAGEIRPVLVEEPFGSLLINAVASWSFEPAVGDDGPVPAHVLVAGVFRAPVLRNDPALGTLPALLALPSEQLPVPLQMVAPVYPVHGYGDHVVVIEALVDWSGAVAETEVLAGEGAFAEVARDAARSWRFQPAEDTDPRPAAVVLVFGFREPLANAPPVLPR